MRTYAWFSYTTNTLLPTKYIIKYKNMNIGTYVGGGDGSGGGDSVVVVVMLAVVAAVVVVLVGIPYT